MLSSVERDGGNVPKLMSTPKDAYGSVHSGLDVFFEHIRSRSALTRSAYHLDLLSSKEMGLPNV